MDHLASRSLLTLALLVAEISKQKCFSEVVVRLRTALVVLAYVAYAHVGLAQQSKKLTGLDLPDEIKKSLIADSEEKLNTLRSQQIYLSHFSVEPFFSKAGGAGQDGYSVAGRPNCDASNCGVTLYLFTPETGWRDVVDAEGDAIEPLNSFKNGRRDFRVLFHLAYDDSSVTVFQWNGDHYRATHCYDESTGKYPGRKAKPCDTDADRAVQ